jgi:hypothetical protein
MKRKVIRKQWLEYSSDDTCYGQWRIKHDGVIYHGFGIYLLNGQDAWLDEECATPSEKEEYKKYCKARGFSDKS